LLIVRNVPDYDMRIDYFQLYWTTFGKNQILLEELKKKSEERNEQLRNMIKMQASGDSVSNAEAKSSHRKKHMRRTAKEISKDEICPYSG